MTTIYNQVKQARREFIHEIFEEIKAEAYSQGFYLSTYYILATLGLHMIAKEEQLLNREKYNNSETHDLLLKIIKEFLVKYIK